MDVALHIVEQPFHPGGCCSSPNCSALYSAPYLHPNYTFVLPHSACCWLGCGLLRNPDWHVPNGCNASQCGALVCALTGARPLAQGAYPDISSYRVQCCRSRILLHACLCPRSEGGGERPSSSDVAGQNCDVPSGLSDHGRFRHWDRCPTLSREHRPFISFRRPSILDGKHSICRHVGDWPRAPDAFDWLHARHLQPRFGAHGCLWDRLCRHRACIFLCGSSPLPSLTRQLGGS
mmetsp:Transcript_110929/g.237011  ORF Transcript_110929/g.237011 Transcript_110929/m.237011 type:complete len:234 (+) Transcript_110929:503-1204(+)